MIAKTFIIAKLFHAQSTDFFRQNKSLRRNGDGRPGRHDPSAPMAFESGDGGTKRVRESDDACRCAKLLGVLGLAIACVVSAAAWVYLVAAHGGFWRTGQRLPTGRLGGTGRTGGTARPGGTGHAGRGPASWPAVVAVVPARNEADSLPATLPGLLAQNYPGQFSVFLVDDGSDDGTGAIAAELGEKAARDGGAPLTVVVGQPRPDGWAGKVWAMSQGLAAAAGAGAGSRSGTASVGDTSAGAVSVTGTAAGAVTGTGAVSVTGAGAGTGGSAGYVLFTDADIAWAPTALRDLVRAAEDDDRVLVSQMALLRAETAWERVIVPAFVYFFAQLYPFKKVNDPRSRTSAGAGGCMLIRASALEQAGGLEPMRGALIDDVALGTLLKKHGNRIWLGLTTDIRSSRPYPNLASLWHMIARSAYVQLRYNPALLAGTLIGLLLLYAVPPAGVVAALIAVAVGATGSAVAVTGIAGLLGWALMTASYLPMLRFYRLSPLRAPGLPLIAILYAGMTADSARRHYSGAAVSWRGRAADRV
jgi:hopene-associated glycosyltransferase HpnB